MNEVNTSKREKTHETTLDHQVQEINQEEHLSRRVNSPINNQQQQQYSKSQDYERHSIIVLQETTNELQNPLGFKPRKEICDFRNSTEQPNNTKDSFSDSSSRENTPSGKQSTSISQKLKVKNKKSFDLSKSLPPANPLAPKIYQEDYKIYTAIDIQFDLLPDFNKTERYIFEEPEGSQSFKQQQQQYQPSQQITEETIEKLKEERSKTLFDYHQANSDRMIYQRHPGRADAACQGYRVGQQVYFATIICRLNKLLCADKKNYLQENIKRNRKESNQLLLLNTKKEQLQGNKQKQDGSILLQHKNSNNESKQEIQVDSSKQLGNNQNNINNQGKISQISSFAGDTLKFSSEFESGNLFTVYQVGDHNYELIVSNDINTKGNTQWFFFKVYNTTKDISATFTILNFVKSGSLFNSGLCPVTFSVQENTNTGTEWVRDGTNIKYYKNNIFREGSKTMKFYSSLQFTYTFRHDEDTVYFAHSFPYTYTDLQEDLNKIMINPLKNKMVSKKTLCTTLAGNSCDMLTITSTNGKKRSQRKGVVIFARQHPGETCGSLMMKGVIDYLLGSSPEAEYLRDNCVFKIVPMVNPDGVIHGNYRCDLAGADLNRRWKKPKKKLHPTVFALKEMIKKSHLDRATKLVLDLHGHSRKMGAFFYGCNYRDDPLKTRIFPYLLSKINSKILFPDCRFSMDAYKESTARITLWKELHAPNVFTLEASFYGYKCLNKEQQLIEQPMKNTDNQSELNQNNNDSQIINRQNSNKENKLNSVTNSGEITADGTGTKNPQQNGVASKHFTIQDYLDIGKDICINLLNILKEEASQKDSKTEPSKIASQIQEMTMNKSILETGELSQSGSDSNPSEDDLDDEEMLNILPKNAMSKNQKNLLAERLKKEKNLLKEKSLKKLKDTPNVPVPAPQPQTQQVLSDIKRKQTNQMYLQRYMQKKQQEINALKEKNQKQPVQKRDQEMQTDSSFLYDLFLSKEKKKIPEINTSSNDDQTPFYLNLGQQNSRSPEKIISKTNLNDKTPGQVRETTKVRLNGNHVAGAKSVDSKGLIQQNSVSGMHNKQMSGNSFGLAGQIDINQAENRLFQQPPTRQLRSSSKIATRNSNNSPIKQQRELIEGSARKLPTVQEQLSDVSRCEDNLQGNGNIVPFSARKPTLSSHISDNGSKMNIDLSSIRKYVPRNEQSDSERTRPGEEKGRIPERFPGPEDISQIFSSSKQIFQDSAQKLLSFKSGNQNSRGIYEQKQISSKLDYATNFLPSLQSPKIQQSNQQSLQQYSQRYNSDQKGNNPQVKSTLGGQTTGFTPQTNQLQIGGSTKGSNMSNIFRSIVPSSKEPLKSQSTSFLLQARQNLQSQLKQ